MLMYSGQVIRDGGAAESYSRVYKEMRRVSVVVGWGSCEQVGLNLTHWGCVVRRLVTCETVPPCPSPCGTFHCRQTNALKLKGCPGFNDLTMSSTRVD